MITVADRDLSIFDFSLALRAGVGSLMIVPKSLSPHTPGSTRHDQSPVPRYKSSQG